MLSSARRQVRHQCGLCEKSYERPDHLSRHLRSHDNSRPFQCAKCHKGFNRLDLLNRHVMGHGRNLESGETESSKRQKVTQACRGCVLAKTKCENQKPCRRCRKRNDPCIPSASAKKRRKEKRRGPDSALSTSPQTTDDEWCLPGSAGPGLDNQDEQCTVPLGMPEQSISTSATNFHSQSGSINTADAPNSLDGQPNLRSFLDPFVTSMVSPLAPFTTTLYTENTMFGSDFAHNIPFSFDDLDFQQLDLFLPDLCSKSLVGSETEVEGAPRPDPISVFRADAFQSSPWIFHPPRNRGSLSQQQDIGIDEDRTALNSVPQAPKQRRLPELLNTLTRDKIFKLVLDISPSHRGIGSFPSTSLLARVMDAFFLQEAESFESKIHPAMLSTETTRPELILGIIANGGVTVNNEPIRKMARAFYEIVRLSVVELWERDNSITRELQTLQAYLLWLEGGFWYGYQRSMELVSGLSQPLYTLLTKANAFAGSNHISVQLYAGYPTEAIEILWQDYLEKESMKRLAIQAFLQDSRVSIALLRSPLIANSQMKIALPSSRELWLAPDAQTWAQIIISGTSPIAPQPLSMVNVFSNIDLLDEIQSQVDVYLCYLMALHAAAARIWNYKQYAGIADGPYNKADSDATLLNTAAKEQLNKSLTRLHTKCLSLPDEHPTLILLSHFLHILFHSPLENLQRFAGSDGPHSALDVVPKVLEWSRGKDARTAIWNAGQVLHWARQFRTGSLKGFWAVGVYFAALTLWAFGIMMSRDASNTVDIGQKGDGRGEGGDDGGVSKNVMVVLDGDKGMDVSLFVMFNQGNPCLNVTPKQSTRRESEEAGFCRLEDAGEIMMIAAAILETNFPEKISSAPPMVSCLVDLMKRLGGLSETEEGKKTKA